MAVSTTNIQTICHCSENKGTNCLTLFSLVVSLESKLFRTAWTHKWIPTLRGVDLEPSTKRETNRTRTLVSLY